MDVRRSLLRLQEAGRAEVRLVDITDTDAVIAACDGANVLWLESPTNPLLGIADLPRLCAVARERGMLCVVDNTFATPLLQRPLELGADVVVHSATKAMGGHSDLLLGAVVAADDTHFARPARGARARRRDTRRAGDLPVPARPAHAAAAPRARPAQRRRARRAPRRPPRGPRGALPGPGVPPAAPAQPRARSPAPGSCSPSACAAAPHAPTRSSTPSRVLTHATSLGGVETTLERRARYPAERGIVPDDLLRVSVGCRARRGPLGRPPAGSREHRRPFRATPMPVTARASPRKREVAPCRRCAKP